jgi:hypothetical protein
MRNMGSIDRLIRVVAGVIVILIAALVSMNDIAQIILWVVGAILVLTTAIGFCPLYKLLHISTQKK